MVLVFAMAAAAMAQLRFVPTHPGPNTPEKPILGVLNGGLDDSLNQISIANDTDLNTVIIERGYFEILSSGVEYCWYLNYWIGDKFDYKYEGTSTGGQTATLEHSMFVPAKGKVDLGINEFSARDWHMIGGDYGEDPNDMTYLKNTANAKDTIAARVTFVLSYYDTITWRTIYDTISKNIGIEYNRGQLIPGLGLKGKSKSRLQAIAGGWKVLGEGTWSLRTSDGRQVPLRQRHESSGEVLEPQVPFRGLGILTDAKGRSQPVFASP